MPLKQQWNDLLECSLFDSFFCCHDWICGWWKTFSVPDDSISVVIAEDDEKIVAIAPLMLHQHSEYGFSLRVLRFIGVPNADRCDFIVRKGYEAVVSKLVNYVVTNVTGWDQIHLNEVPTESLLVKCLKKNKGLLYIEPASECPYVSLNKWNGWDDYYKSLSKKTRLELNRKNNALIKEGKSKYHHQLNPESDGYEFITACDLEYNSLKAQRISVDNLVLTGEKQRNFQKFLMNNTGHYKVLFSWLERENQLISYLYGFVYKKHYYAYNTAYSAESVRYYPGKLIINETIRYCFENNIEVFDLLRGATHLKSRWTKCSKKQINIYYLKKTPKNLLYTLMVFRIRPSLKRAALFFLNKFKL